MAKKEEAKKKVAHEYNAQDITVLEGLEPVRKRPGMYIGEVDERGLHHLIWEIFDNSRDEAMNGYADRIEVTILPDNYIRVVDNGRGIPVDVHAKTKVSALETIMTTLHAGGKFGGEGYNVSGGLHGVGASVVNALSIYMKVEVHRDGLVYMQEYSQGKAKARVKQVGKTKFTGTITTFKPDKEIFKETTEFNFEKIVGHLRQQAYLVRSVLIRTIDARECTKLDLDNKVYFSDLGYEVPTSSFFFEGGLKSLLKHYNEFSKPIHRNIFYIEKEHDGVQVEIAMQYIDDITTRVIAFANNIVNSEGGTHVAGFKLSLTRIINTYARKNNVLKEKDENLTGEDVLEGLTAIISVKMREVQFSSQTKSKLTTLEAQPAVSTVFSDAFSAFLEENPDDAREIINKGILALRARKAAKAAKDSVLRKGALEGFNLPGKLADCAGNTSAEDAELFIVEGDSAGGSSKQGRDRKTQAILPLKGKILNVERARLDKMLASVEIRSLVLALGTLIGDTFNLDKLRYHKIIIATDADVDGEHIRTLILTLFYRHFRPLLDGGFIYIAQPPLFKIKRGKEVNYAYSEEEMKKIVGKDAPEIAEMIVEIEGEENEEEAPEDTKAKRVAKVTVARYKGLGEMNPEELWETTMDPKRRILKQVKIEDAQEADKVFDVLMGTDVPSRKSFIQSNATKAQLDI
jgi:DNA gyrase subunit B